MIRTIGRRKTSIAILQMDLSKTGTILINGIDYQKYFQDNVFHMTCIFNLFEILSIDKFPNMRIQVSGGGLSAQSEACQLAIARALNHAPYHQVLKSKGFLTQDARQKERRKYGLKKARKAPQFSKR